MMTPKQLTYAPIFLLALACGSSDEEGASSIDSPEDVGGAAGETPGDEPLAGFGGEPGTEPELFECERVAQADRFIDSLTRLSARGEYWVAGQGREKAFDGDVDSKWLDFSSSSWLEYRLNSGEQASLEAYSITSADDEPGRDPVAWSLMGSNDGESWSVVDQRSEVEFPERGQTLEFEPSSPGSFQVYRIELEARTPSLGILQVAELDFSFAASEEEPSQCTQREIDCNSVIAEFGPESVQDGRIDAALLERAEGCELGLAVIENTPTGTSWYLHPDLEEKFQGRSISRVDDRIFVALRDGEYGLAATAPTLISQDFDLCQDTSVQLGETWLDGEVMDYSSLSQVIDLDVESNLSCRDVAWLEMPPLDGEFSGRPRFDAQIRLAGSTTAVLSSDFGVPSGDLADGFLVGVNLNNLDGDEDHVFWFGSGLMGIDGQCSYLTPVAVEFDANKRGARVSGQWAVSDASVPSCGTQAASSLVSDGRILLN